MADVKDQVRRRFTGTTAEFDAVWGYLLETGRVDLLAGDPVDDTLLEAEEILALLRKAAPGDHPDPLKREDRSFKKEVEVGLDDYTREREEVFSEAAAAMAATHPDVLQFRSDDLGGQLLTRGEAGEVLFGDSDASREIDADVLWRLAEQLAKHYHWRDYEAAWFVLTGDAPRFQILTATLFRSSGRDYYPNTARITVTADPCVDAKTVEKLYRSAQRQLLGGDNRKLAQRTLEAARFAAQQIKKNGPESWRRRTERWNRLFPQWRYMSRGGLRQAFEKFWHPDYGRPRWKPYDPTPAQQSRDQHHSAKIEALSKRFGPPKSLGSAPVRRLE